MLIPLVSGILVLTSYCEDRRQAIIRGSIAYGLVVFVVAELLSLFGHFHALGLLTAWAALSFMGVWAVWLSSRGRPPKGRTGATPKGAEEWAMVGFLIGMGALTLILALFSPPNTWDVLTYHMPRVMHWLQNGSVDFFPASIDRQLFTGPFASYLVASFHGIAGWDLFANIPQWLAGIGCAVATSRIVKQLGGDRRTQLFAAFVLITLPIAILESTTVQTDLITSFLVVAVISAILDDIEAPQGPWSVITIGGGIGLALLAKATSILILPPFLLWWAICRLQRQLRPALITGGFAMMTTVIVVAPHAIRCLSTFGNVLGPPDTVGILHHARFGLGPLFSTAVRNIATNFAQPSEILNQLLLRAVVRLHGVFGLDPSDPDTSFLGLPFTLPIIPNEDFVPNGPHTILVILSVAYFLARPGISPKTRIYSTSLLTAFLLFSGYLRWQPWIVRLQLPLFAVACPVGALFLGRLARPQRARMLTNVTHAAAMVWTGFVALFSLWLLWNNDSRPLNPADPKSVLTTERAVLGERAGAVEDAVAFFKKSRVYLESEKSVVGLAVRSTSWEYPFWAELGAPNRRIRVVTLNPIPQTARRSPPRPDVVFCSLPAPQCTPWTGHSWETRVFRGPVSAAMGEITVSVRVADAKGTTRVKNHSIAGSDNETD